MKHSEFLRKSLVEKIQHIYEQGTIVADTLFNQYRVNLVLINGNCFEIFVQPATLTIASIQPLDHGSVRMRRYNNQMNIL
ncbi:MAG: hypothetical protein JXR07_08185 [Reichenbachiella sp.]